MPSGFRPDLDPDQWIIHDGNAHLFVDPVIDGQRKAHGLKPRNFAAHPPGVWPSAPEFPDSLLIDEAEWPERLAEQVAKKTSLFDLRETHYEVLKSLDQNGYGLCWNFSSTKAAMYQRVLQNEEPVILSPWWGAGKIKGWRDQGGWGQESTQYIADHGVPLMSLCPSYSSRYDTPEVAADAAKHKTTEWWDGSDSRERNRKIMVTLFLLGQVPIIDLDWMGHSMCGCRLVSLNPLTVDADNSWGESSGNKGIYRLVGSKAVPDNIVAPRVVMGG